MLKSHAWVAATATLLALITIAASPVAAAAQDDPPYTMRIGARVQVRATHAEPEDATGVTALAIRRARLSMSGAAYRHFDYAIQVELAGASARLLDANVRASLAPWVSLWAGQGKAFFGRQQLTSSGSLQFVDRTVVDGRFAAGRQQGLAVLGSVADGRVEYNAGVYNGNGINQATNQNDRFMTVGRVVFMPFGTYSPVESAHDYPTSPRLALGLSALGNAVGEGAAEADVRRVNGEAAFKLRGVNMTGEFYREWVDPPAADPSATDQVVTDGWYTQAGYLFPGRTHEIAGRWAVISPRAAGAGDTVETGIGYSYYFAGHRAKLQTDLRNVRDVAADADHRELRIQLQLTL